MQYRVRAQDNQGNVSDWNITEVLSVKVKEPPVSPTELYISELIRKKHSLIQFHGIQAST